MRPRRSMPLRRAVGTWWAATAESVVAAAAALPAPPRASQYWSTLKAKKKTSSVLYYGAMGAAACACVRLGRRPCGSRRQHPPLTLTNPPRRRPGERVECCVCWFIVLSKSIESTGLQST